MEIRTLISLCIHESQFMPCIVNTERYVFAFGFVAVVPQLVSLQVSPTVVATISKLQLQTESREGWGE